MINAENPEAKLMPGMTASVSFEIAQYNDIIKVPNAALRFSPPGVAETLAKEAPPKKEAPPEGEAPKKTEGDGPPRKASGGAAKGAGRRTAARVWVLGADGSPSMVQIHADATDGAFTRLLKGDLVEGQEVIIGIVLEGGDAMTNPFAPGRAPAAGGRGR